MPEDTNLETDRRTEPDTAARTRPWPSGLVAVFGFAIITLALTFVWLEWGRVAYGDVLKIIAPPLYDLIGFEGARVGAYRLRYINVVPFVGLVLVTPGLGFKRRAIGLVLGGLALVVCHLALNLSETVASSKRLPIVASLVSDTLPFVLWIVVAYPALGSWFAKTLAQPDHPSGRERSDSRD